MTSDDRKALRTREIFENAVCALVIEHQVSANVAAKLLVTEASKVLSPRELRLASMEE